MEWILFIYFVKLISINIQNLYSLNLNTKGKTWTLDTACWGNSKEVHRPPCRPSHLSPGWRSILWSSRAKLKPACLSPNQFIKRLDSSRGLMIGLRRKRRSIVEISIWVFFRSVTLSSAPTTKTRWWSIRMSTNSRPPMRARVEGSQEKFLISNQWATSRIIPNSLKRSNSKRWCFWSRSFLNSSKAESFSKSNRNLKRHMRRKQRGSPPNNKTLLLIKLITSNLLAMKF